MRARGPWPMLVRRRPGRSARGGTYVLALALGLTLVGCNGATVGPGDSSTPTSGAGSASPIGTASDEPSTEPSVGPTATATRTPTQKPSARPSPTATSASPTPASVGGVNACTGSATPNTRDFFVAFADFASWPVYCAVLPKGWSVEHGEYHFINGGRLTISYTRRSDGARIVLDEGSVCATTNPCVPSGSDLGTTAFADRQADLSTITNGFAAVVDETENPAWLLTGTGLDRDDFTSIAAKLHQIDR